jgi:uncharacterized repeat protein (TIGR03809 family)
MTHRGDVARGRDIVARWCNLAEQRLEYLTELFETGRWRRFHSENAFLENIKEARDAVETWRDLLTREASLDNSALDLSWIGGARTALPRGEGSRAPARRLQPQPASVAVQSPCDIPGDVLVALENQLAALREVAPSVADAPAPDDAALPVLSVMQERYPLLRNAL